MSQGYAYPPPPPPKKAKPSSNSGPSYAVSYEGKASTNASYNEYYSTHDYTGGQGYSTTPNYAYDAGSQSYGTSTADWYNSYAQDGGYGSSAQYTALSGAGSGVAESAKQSSYNKSKGTNARGNIRGRAGSVSDRGRGRGNRGGGRGGNFRGGDRGRGGRGGSVPNSSFIKPKPTPLTSEEKQKIENNNLKQLVAPKPPHKILNEMMGGRVKYEYTDNPPLPPGAQETAEMHTLVTTIDGDKSSGTGPSHEIAKNICAEHAIMEVVARRYEAIGEMAQKGESSREDLLLEDETPFELASIAIFKMLNEWEAKVSMCIFILLEACLNFSFCHAKFRYSVCSMFVYFDTRN